MSVVPSIRLIWSLLGVVILAALGGPLPELSPLWPPVVVLLACVALADLALSLRSHVAATVTAKPLQRLTKDRPGKIALRIGNPGGRARVLRMGLGLPAGLETETPEIRLVLPQGTEDSECLWHCTPTRRGNFNALQVALEQSSLAGFWQLRSRSSLAGEIRSYPNLFSERKTLAALFLPRSQFGLRLRSATGRGREFEKLRDYQNGDPFDEIHWKATAKRNSPVTKVFQTERTQEIYVVIDASRLSARAITHEGKTVTTLERYITSALLLLIAASRQADRFGLVVFDDRVRLLIRAGQGPRHYAACRDAVHALQPGNATPDLGELVRQLRSSLTQRALLFFLTDLTDPVLAEDACAQLGLLARQHLVLVNQLRPAGVAPLFKEGEVAEDSELYGRIAGHIRWTEARALTLRLRPLGIQAHLMENETMAEELVSQYLRVKERRLL